METKRKNNFILFTGILLSLIPVILYLRTGVVQKSISSYVYTCPLVFASLLSIGAWAYFSKGFVSPKGRFDMIIGLALFGVVFTPCDDFFILHYCFATLFFLGNTFNIVYFTSNSHRKYMIILGGIILLALAGHFFFNLYSLFYAEWIGLIPMAANYVLEGLGLTE